MKNTKNKKITGIALVAAIILIIFGVLYYSKINNTSSIDVKLDEEKREKLDEEGKAKFKFTPKKDGYYYLDWVEYGLEEGKSGKLYLYENMKKKIKVNSNVFYFKRGNSYYFIDDMSKFLANGRDYEVSLKVKSFESGKITDDKTVTIDKDTVLYYSGTASEVKRMVVDGDGETVIKIESINGSKISTMGYAKNGNKNMFQSIKGAKMRLICKNISKETKITIKKIPTMMKKNKELTRY